MVRALAIAAAGFLLAGPAHAGPVSPMAKCKDFKARGAAMKAQDLLKAFARNSVKPNALRLGTDISKAQSNFTRLFSKAEATGGCYTPGDVGPMEAKVDGFVAQMIEEMGPPVCGNSVKGGSEECDAGPAGGASADCTSGACLADCTCAGCGDGSIGGGEDCDDGPANGTAASCCGATCQFRPGGAACGDPSSTACSAPDACNGAGACLANHAAPGAACGDPSNTACSAPDTCSGAGACLANHAAPGAACGDPSNTACSAPDACNGAGACLANHAAPGAACGDQGVQCQNDDTCNGAGSCTDNGPSIVGTPCGNPSNTACTDPDTCNGAGACLANHAPGGAPCGDQGVPCRVDDACDGNGNCTDNGAEAASTPCPDADGEPCTTAGCDGAGVCDQGHVIAPDGSTPAGCDASGCSPGACQSGVCTGASSCCTDFPNGFLSFETGLATGNCGVLRNFRCSNDANAACAVNADCGASNTCNEVIGGGIPLNLECGGLYTGGGGNSVPLPFPVPDMGQSYTRVTSCDPNTGVLVSGPTAPGDGGGLVTGRNCTTGRTCTGGAGDGATCVIDTDCDSSICTTNCVFGPPLPIPNAMTPPTSVCTINDVAQDASATTQCDGGDTDVSAPLRSNVYLSGDLFTMTTPPNIPGVQPCPLCDRFCIGGTNANFPCNDNSDCASLDCNTQTTCLGGPNSGLDCTPATSDSPTLGDNQNAYPTSHDCPPEPSLSITDSIGGLPIAFALTSGTIQRNAEDLGLGAGGNRVFAGFCRDSFGEGSGCFEGDTNVACPVAGDLNGVPCDTDADCSAPYESCAQRTAGAFSRAAATQINVFGSPDGQCLGDGALHAGTLVSVFDIPPTFDAVVDAAGDLPGPGTAMLQGTAQLQ